MPEKKCFVISPFGDSDPDAKKRADDIFYYVLPEVFDPSIYKLDRADLIDSSGLVSTQIIQHLKEDFLVIADLAYYNPNVFYELAIRHVTKKPYIQLRLPNQKIPFDIANIRTITIDTADLKSVKEAKDRIKGHVEHINETTPNPISSALDELSFEGSSSDKTGFREIMSYLSEIRGAVNGIGKMPTDQEDKIRLEATENALKQIQQVTELSYPAVNALKTSDKLPIELKAEVEKIEKAFHILNDYRIQVSMVRKHIFMRQMGTAMRQPNHHERPTLT